MEKMTSNEYFDQIHTRVNHVQKLQTYVTNVISSAAVVIPGIVAFMLRLLERGDGSLKKLLEVAFIPTYVVVMTTLLWAQLVSIYQTFCIYKLVKLLGELELDLQPRGMQNDPYFPHGGVRRFYYALLHLLPTLYLTIIPSLVYSFGSKYVSDICGPAVLLGSSLATVYVSLSVWIFLLYRVFYYRYPMWVYWIRCLGDSDCACNRARTAKSRNIERIRQKGSS